MLDIIANNTHSVEKIIIAGSMSSYGEGKYNCPNCGDIRPKPRSQEQMAKGDWELHCPNCDYRVQPVPTDEAKILDCASVYAMTKRDQEEMALNIGNTYQIPVVVLRYFNVYGPRQSLSNPYTGVIAIFLSRILNNKPPVIYEDGLQSRDFVSVHDIVKANLLAMENDSANFQIINVGTGKATTVNEIASTLARLLHKDIKPRVTYKFRKGDIRHCFANITRAKQLLHFEPEVSLEDGLQEIIAWSKSAQATDKFEAMEKELKKKGIV